MEKIMAFIVATNVIASELPKRWPLVPIAKHNRLLFAAFVKLIHLNDLHDDETFLHSTSDQSRS